MAVAEESEEEKSAQGSSARLGNQDAGGVEHMLLVALESLYGQDRELDVRKGLLRVLLQVLQRHGTFNNQDCMHSITMLFFIVCSSVHEWSRVPVPEWSWTLATDRYHTLAP